jgi:uncharacterized protein YpbB
MVHRGEDLCVVVEILAGRRKAGVLYQGIALAMPQVFGFQPPFSLHYFMPSLEKIGKGTAFSRAA